MFIDLLFVTGLLCPLTGNASRLIRIGFESVGADTPTMLTLGKPYGRCTLVVMGTFAANQFCGGRSLEDTLVGNHSYLMVANDIII